MANARILIENRVKIDEEIAENHAILVDHFLI